MKKNHPLSIKLSQEEADLLSKALSKLNSETSFEINKTSFCRIAIKRICYEVVSGNIKSSEVLFNSK